MQTDDGRPAFSRSPNYKWYIVGMLWFMAFFNYADRQALASVLPLIEKEFSLNKEQQGFIVAAFAWVYGLGAPFAGYIVDRVKRKTAILAGLYAWSVICMATAMSTKLSHLIFFRAAEGVGETFYFPASMSLVSDYHGKRTRSRAMGLHQTSVYAGTIGGGFFAGMIGEYYGWRWSFIIFGGLGILLGIVLHRLVVEPQRGAADFADSGVKTKGPVQGMSVLDTAQLIFSTPTTLFLLGAFLCANFVAAVMLSWMPSLLHEKFNLSLTRAGFEAVVYLQVASMCASPLGGWLADNLRGRFFGGRMFVQATGVFLGAPFVYATGTTSTLSTLVVVMACWGFCKGLYDANIFASIYDVIPANARGTAAGLMNCIGWLAGAGTAPIIVGRIADQYDLGYAIALTSGVYIAAGVILMLGALFFIRRDAERLHAKLASESSPPA
ncbi:MAG: MFS transporter [Candidatus Hydrogenedentes bacterium]|nr:MFS transporter [Candidatus Hydrogenedentota bacterium]